MENTEKSKLLQEENNHANNNLGITQSSGLENLSGYPDNLSNPED